MRHAGVPRARLPDDPTAAIGTYVNVAVLRKAFGLESPADEGPMP